MKYYLIKTSEDKPDNMKPIQLFFVDNRNQGYVMCNNKNTVELTEQELWEINYCLQSESSEKNSNTWNKLRKVLE